MESDFSLMEQNIIEPPCSHYVTETRQASTLQKNLDTETEMTLAAVGGSSRRVAGPGGVGAA